MTNSPVVRYLQPITVTESSSGMALIDCVYVINLDERPEKWQRMQKLLLERGIRANRFAAINGWKLSTEAIKELMGPYHKPTMTGGNIGCYLSHFSVYKDAFERGYKLIWVLEDDADFIDDIHQIPEYIAKLTKIDHKWDIFYTDVDCRNDTDGYFPFVVSEEPRKDRLLPKPFGYYSIKFLAGEGLLRLHGRYGATSMLIQRSGLKKIVEYLSQNYIATAIDCELHFIPTIHEYAPTKEIVTNLRRDAFSDTKRWSGLNSPNQENP